MRYKFADPNDRAV